MLNIPKRLRLNSILMKRIHTIAILILTLCLYSCHKDSDDGTQTTKVTTPTTTLTNAIQGTYWGSVVDEKGAPIADATVIAYDKTTKTDKNGFFKLEKALLSPTGSYTKIVKEGYFDASDLIYSAGDNAKSHIVMLRMENPATIDASKGGTVEVKGGGSLEFPAESIMDKNGKPYLGTMKVYTKRIATDDPYFASKMPGGLYAKDASGRNIVLGSLGMLAVELRDGSGQELQVREGKEVRTLYPIAQHQQDGAPETIPLWSFDEDEGLWKEEGVAVRKGGAYVGGLTHFSFWNWDAPFPLVKISGTIHVNGSPAAYKSLEIITGIYGVGYGYTDGEGKFCGLVPRGENLTLKVYGYGACVEASTHDLGSFEETSDVGVINLETSAYTISGKVQCINEAVSEGYINIVLNNGEVVLQGLFENGRYSYELLHTSCYADAGTIQVVDLNTGKASQPQAIDLSTQEQVIDIQLCDPDCNLTASFTTNDAEVCTREELILTVSADGGTAPYTYAWTSGATTSTLAYGGELGSYCLDITDAAGCTATFCKNIDTYFRDFYVEGWAVIDCESGMADINLNVYDQYPPLTITVNGDTYPASGSDSLLIVENITPTEVYTVEVTDGRGCSASTTIDRGSTGGSYPLFEFTQESYGLCNGSVTLEAQATVNTPLIYSWTYNGGGVINGATQSTLEVGDPGIYCLTASNDIGCTYKRCVSVTSTFIEYDSLGISCANGTWSIPDLPIPNPTYENNTNEQLIQIGSSYSMTVSGTDQNGCSVSFEKAVMSPEVLAITKNQATSCADCADGYIEFTTLMVTPPCETCQTEYVKIYNVNDYNTDRSQDNTDKKLEKGTYILIGYTESGCAVAKTPFTIE